MTRPGPPARLSTLSVFHSESGLHGFFGWARRAPTSRKRFSARAVPVKVLRTSLVTEDPATYALRTVRPFPPAAVRRRPYSAPLPIQLPLDSHSCEGLRLREVARVGARPPACHAARPPRRGLRCRLDPRPAHRAVARGAGRAAAAQGRAAAGLPGARGSGRGLRALARRGWGVGRPPRRRARGAALYLPLRGDRDTGAVLSIRRTPLSIGAGEPEEARRRSLLVYMEHPDSYRYAMGSESDGAE